MPRIRALAPQESYQVRLRTFGLPESVVGERFRGVEQLFPGVTIGYRAHFPEIEVKVLARTSPASEARDLAERATQEVRMRIADVIYGEGDDTFAGVLGRELRSRSYKLAIAESCTGGLIGHLLTKEPGASEFLVVDAVTYANTAKTRMLGVGEEVIRGHGAVSSEVAAAMAEGVKHVSGADVALAVTGIAGPSGGSDEKPVGTVFLAVAWPGGLVVKERRFPGDRTQVQARGLRRPPSRSRTLLRAAALNARARTLIASRSGLCRARLSCNRRRFFSLTAVRFALTKCAPR